MGLAPALSGMRASLTLIAMRSSEIAARPAAWPVATTSSGWCSSISSSSRRRDAPNTVGSSAPTILLPAITSPSSWCTACQLGLVRLPPKGSKPVTKTVDGLRTAGLGVSTMGPLYNKESSMRWEGNRQSSNVEDLRSGGGGGGGFGLGGG